MKDKTLYCAGSTPAATYAAQELESHGFRIVDHPGLRTDCILLDVPSFGPGRGIRNSCSLDTLLAALRNDVHILGGNLDPEQFREYQTLDLLKDEYYLCGNAAITADCTIQIAAPLLTKTFFDSNILILGWGRIGKCLAQLLQKMGCSVLVAARKATDRAMLDALGYDAIPFEAIPNFLPKTDLLINTVPSPVLDAHMLSRNPRCINIDLASQKGLEGENVIWARGLPGIHAPESSGKLIARAYLKHIKEVTT